MNYTRIALAIRVATLAARSENVMPFLRCLDPLTGVGVTNRQILCLALIRQHEYRAALLTLAPLVRRFGSARTYQWAAMAIELAVPEPNAQTVKTLALLRSQAHEPGWSPQAA